MGGVTPPQKDVFMRDPIEVLQMKEQELSRVRSEVNALKVAARLLTEDNHDGEQKREPKIAEMP
jgi:hypothetical protein